MLNSRSPRKIMFFDNDEETSVITKLTDLSNDASITNVFGIDLGTTNSVISIVKTGAPEAIRLVNGKKTFPSCVMWKDGEFIVGDEAYDKKGSPNVVYSVKRLMEDASATVTFVDGDKTLTMTPTEVSAEILKGIVRATDGMYGVIKDVVVTVPAYFNDIGKRNTMKACELAGLNLIALENEPSAAALEYDLQEGVSSEDVVVYDLGGGTFDVTLARIMKVENNDFGIYQFDNAEASTVSKIIKPIALGGNGRLGGDDIDDELLQIVLNKVHLKESDLDEYTVKSMTATFEKIKKSGVDQSYSYHVNVNTVAGVHVEEDVSITPDDFIDSVMPVYKKTRKELLKVLQERPNNATKLLLVGGSTKNPIIQDMLKKDFPEFEISSVLNPDLVVGTGAAIKGRILKYGDSSISSFDILPMTIGVLEGESKVVPVITKNSELPVTKSTNFTTEVDNQTEVKVAIYQGNSTFKDECVYLGDLTITGIEKAKAGVPNLSINLTISANNVLICEATIDGITRSLQLSLNNDSVKQNNKTYTKEEKKILIWREYARELGGNDGKKLTEMLDNYPASVSLDEIKDFIRKTRHV